MERGRFAEAPLAGRLEALRLLDGRISRQAGRIALEHVFFLFGMLCLLAVPLLLFRKSSKGMFGGGAAH